ncbi:MAG: hypothetical protein KBD25_04770 [Rickettsiaceae bacterium]|nr:hypothetical protein [Rickettsiaceae bacterium]
MSEYQYYEFCKLHSPMSKETRQIMHSLSSRAKVGTHNASYIYNYGDFRGDSEKLLLEHFDVYFYINKFGTIKLCFKYNENDLDLEKLNQYRIEDVIDVKKYDANIILDLHICPEEGGCSWLDADDMLADLMPLYDEIKNNNYQLLDILTAINNDFHGKEPGLSDFIKNKSLTSAQQSYVDCVNLFN